MSLIPSKGNTLVHSSLSFLQTEFSVTLTPNTLLTKQLSWKLSALSAYSCCRLEGQWMQDWENLTLLSPVRWATVHRPIVTEKECLLITMKNHRPPLPLSTSLLLLSSASPTIVVVVLSIIDNTVVKILLLIITIKVIATIIIVIAVVVVIIITAVISTTQYNTIEL